MLGFLTTPNSARAHSAAAAEHDLAARAVPHTTAKGAGASKALNFQSFIEEKKDAASHTLPYSSSASEDTAPPVEQPPEGEGEMSDAFVETDSDFAESDDATAALEWEDALSILDGLGAASSDAFMTATSQTSSETSVAQSQAASQLSGDISNSSTISAAAATKAASAIGGHGMAPDQSSATRATVLNPAPTSQSTSGIVPDQAPEPRGSSEALGRISSAITGEPMSKDIAAPPKQALPMSSGMVVPVQNGALVERPAKEATKSVHLASDMPAPSLATSRGSAQLQHAWLMTNAPTAAGIKITAAGASLPATDIIPGDSTSFAPDTGGDANLAAEGSTHRAANEARTAAFMVHHGATTARNIAAQISEAMAKAAERSIDVILNPAELGRVRITLSHSDAGMMVNVAAERAETLDMMRRHSDILRQEFTDLGYGGTDFTFAREDGASKGNRAQTSGEAALDAGPTIESGTTIVLRAASADRLDIRL